MAMQPSIQLSQTLKRALKRLRAEYQQEFAHIKVKNRFHFIPAFAEWVTTRKVLGVEELAAVIASSQLFNSEIDVLQAGLPLIKELSRNDVPCLMIGADPDRNNKPVIVAALPITS